MTDDDLLVRAAPACPECGEPISHVDVIDRFVDAGRWMTTGTMVCPHGHRTMVAPLERA